MNKNINVTRFMGFGEEAQEMRSRTHEVIMSNLEIIRVSYICKEMIEKCIEYDLKLLFEQANCYYNCFNLIRKLLKLVDVEYFAVHYRLAEFYKKSRELSTECDRLSFYKVPVTEQAADSSVTDSANPTFETGYLNNIETDAVCVNCIIADCKKKGTHGYLCGCPRDPEQREYLEAFRRRYSGKQI